MGARVFISHSTKDDASRERLDLLRTQLGDAGFDVLIDVERLQPGEKWRDELYTWLGVCDFAVVIITPRSLSLDNPWVAREASILMWRKALDPEFHVLWVLADGAQPSDLASGAFKDLLIEEIQLFNAPGDCHDWMPVAVGQLVARRSRGSLINPVDKLAAPIARQLRQFSPPVLRNLADIIALDLGPWYPMDDPANDIAVSLLHLGVEGAMDAIDTLALEGATPETLETILELIAPSWVDLCAARWLAAMAARNDEKPVLLLNAEGEFGASMFVRRASGRPPPVDWPQVVVPARIGEEGLDELADNLTAALKTTLRLRNDPLAQNDERRLQGLIERHSRTGRPIVVISRYSDGLSPYLRALQTRFPTLTFVAITGKEGHVEDPLPEGFARIVPELRAGEEDAAREAYDYCRAMIKGSY